MKRMAMLTLLVLSLAADARAAMSVRHDANPRLLARLSELPVRIGGRVVEHALGAPAPKGSVGYEHQWPGVYFEAAFRGDRVTLAFADPRNTYRLRIDDAPPVELAALGNGVIQVSGIGAGAHHARLEKVTESVDFAAAFNGFYVPHADVLPAPKPRTHQIEFIGDSSMAGYGDRSAKAACSDEEVRLTTDTQAAYPALVARHFDADYQVNAVSGRGLIRNYGGSTPAVPMARIYGRALPGRGGDYGDPRWQPQIIVLKLNADLATAPKPGEPWRTMGQLAVAYLNGFSLFVGDLHRRYPHAAMLVWWFDPAPTLPQADRMFIEQGRDMIAGAARAAGVRAIDFLSVSHLMGDNDACAHHGNLRDHRRTADWLIAYLDQHPDYWDGR